MDNLNINALKEPRGFIRVLQFIFSICAFATTTNYSSSFSFKIECKNDTGNGATVSHDIAYPFRLSHEQESVKACGKSFEIDFFGDFASDSQFFVTAGVLAMLFSLGSLGFYLLCDQKYRSDKNFPLWDFIATVIVAVFWLSGSAAWASGLSSLKTVCDPSNLFDAIPACKDASVSQCVSTFAGNFAGLNISIIFGFLNFFLWTINLWFLYKETSWFQDAHSGEVQTPGA